MEVVVGQSATDDTSTEDIGLQQKGAAAAGTATNAGTGSAAGGKLKRSRSRNRGSGRRARLEGVRTLFHAAATFAVGVWHTLKRVENESWGKI